MRTLVWFRSDLRTDDNPALQHAAATATRGVVAAVALSGRQWHQHDWAAVKVDFLLRTLADLRARLERLRISLRIIAAPAFADVPAALLALARRCCCDALHFNREYEVDERRRDAEVAALFERAGLTVHACDAQTILPPTAVQTRAGGFYTVFTPYKHAWLAEYAGAGNPGPCPPPRPQPDLPCTSDSIPATVDGFDLTGGQHDLWPAGEVAAQRHLRHFIETGVAAYARERDLPAATGTSRLSPYLTLGVLSPRRCLAELLAAVGPGLLNADAVRPRRGRAESAVAAQHRASAQVWVTELIWREFYRHVLVGFPRVSMNRAFRPDTERLPWRSDEDALAAWCAGQTGIPIVDAGMRELAATGWMHNRVRMITATFLAKHLFIDWRRGEQHFMRHLIDGDLASNNGGWQWCASTGTDAAPYFRVFNPYSQARKFDPQGTYMRQWVPELRAVETRALHDPRLLTAASRADIGYPPPLCDLAAGRTHAIAMFRQLKSPRGHVSGRSARPA